MEDKIFTLKNCGTCQRILKEVGVDDSMDVQNVKEKNISAKELDYLKKKVGSYEELFNKRAMKYRSQELNKRDDISEKEWRSLILGEYTFLKRPVAVVGDEVFVGNTQKVVAALKEKLNG